MAIREDIEAKLQEPIQESSNEELYLALLHLVKERAEAKVTNDGKKKL